MGLKFQIEEEMVNILHDKSIPLPHDAIVAEWAATSLLQSLQSLPEKNNCDISSKESVISEELKSELEWIDTQFQCLVDCLGKLPEFDNFRITLLDMDMVQQ